MMQRTLFFLIALFVFSTILSAKDVPEFRDVPAEKIRQRDGVGNVLEKLNQGETVKIAYLGGSITAANGWRPKTLKWFRETWPKAKIEEIHAAIGGTGSDLGVFRVAHDVLRHEPDLLFVEFAVNDGGASPENIWKGMEGIVRQAWKKNPHTDIVFVYTLARNGLKELVEGRCVRSMSAMETLADFYGIPSINFGVPLAVMEKEGKLDFQAEKPAEGKIHFSTDGVHPLDAGHDIYAEAVADGFKTMNESKPLNHKAKLDRSFILGNWENAKLVSITKAMLKGDDWKRLPESDGLQKSFGNRLGEIWHGGKPGDTLSFQFKGSQAKIYDLVGPNGGQVIITVDGKKSEKPHPRFDSYCTYHRLATLMLGNNLDPNQVHTITVEIHPEQPSRQSVAFRLKEPEKELAEPKFQGTNVWFGKLMLIGDLVE